MKRESLKAKQTRAANCLARLRETYGEVACGLEFDNDPWKLLVMGILAAQCTDKRVNLVSKNLFQQFPTCRDFAEAEIADVAEAICSLGLYQRKAEHIVASAKIIVNKFESQVPVAMTDLLSLPGVGRKIANLVRNDYFKLPGMVVDTHNMRVSKRLALAKGKNPLQIEKELTAVVETAEWGNYGHYMVEHGRNVCQARKPLCQACCLSGLCPSADNV